MPNSQPRSPIRVRQLQGAESDDEGDGLYYDAAGEEAGRAMELAISRHFADLVARILDDTRFHAAADEEFGELVLRYRFVSVRAALGGGAGRWGLALHRAQAGVTLRQQEAK
jgi:hypothetical protein